MKNKNRKKSIIIAIVVVVLCLVGYKIADKVSYPLVRAKAVIYLVDKYDAKISDFEMTDHIHSRFIIEDENPYDLKFKLKWKDFAFEFKYKDRKFIVNRYKGKFYDDYQLEDIEKWCSDWLKNNVDEGFVAVEIDSRDIISYQIASKKGNKYILNQDDAVNFFTTHSYDDFGEQIFYIYYKSNNPESVFDYMYITNTISAKTDTKLDFNFDVQLTTNDNFGSSTTKIESIWCREYSLIN